MYFLGTKKPKMEATTQYFGKYLLCGSVIEAETRTVRDCNVHGDARVRIRKQFGGGDCHRLLRELAEQESGNSYRQGL